MSNRTTLAITLALLVIVPPAAISTGQMPSSADRPTCDQPMAVPGVDCSTWKNRHDGSSGSYDVADAIASDEQAGTVYITGASTGAGPGPDVFTEAIDAASGETLWQTRYDGPSGGRDRALDLDLSPDGSTVFVAGYTSTPQTGRDFVTIAYDAATGEQRWLESYDGPIGGNDRAVSIDVSPRGSLVYVGGASRSSTGHGPTTAPDMLVVAYDAVTGEQFWVVRYDGPANEWDTLASLQATGDGDALYAVGTSTVGHHEQRMQLALVRIETGQGEIDWDVRYEGPSTGNFPLSLELSPEETTVYVAGYDGFDTPTGEDCLTLAFSASEGKLLWDAVHDGGTSDDDVCRDVTVAASGERVFTTGTTTDDVGEQRFSVIAYDAATGKLVWQTLVGMPGVPSGAMDAVLGPGGDRLLASGFTQGPFDRDHLVATLDTATGEVLASHSLDGYAGMDNAVRIAVAEEHVVTTGSSAGPEGDLDALTVAYPLASQASLSPALGPP